MTFQPIIIFYIYSVLSNEINFINFSFCPTLLSSYSDSNALSSEDSGRSSSFVSSIYAICSWFRFKFGTSSLSSACPFPKVRYLPFILLHAPNLVAGPFPSAATEKAMETSYYAFYPSIMQLLCWSNFLVLSNACFFGADVRLRIWLESVHSNSENVPGVPRRWRQHRANSDCGIDLHV